VAHGTSAPPYPHRLRETITHWFVGGVFLLITGLVPEEWLAPVHGYGALLSAAVQRKERNLLSESPGCHAALAASYGQM
jgi:hypothetical protein